MKSIVQKYLAQKVLEDIREGQNIPENLIIEFDKYPIIDFIRADVIADDIPIIVNRYINSSEDGYTAFGISALRGQRDSEPVKKLLFDLWHQDEDFNKKFKTMFRLLDYEDLDISIHEDMYDFVLSNWDKWVDGVIKYFGDDEFLSKIKKRISNKDFPETKLWIRLCQCMASPDKHEVKKILAQYKDSTAPLVQKVVKDLEQKLKE